MQTAVSVHLPLVSAGVAPYVRAVRIGLIFGAAMRAFIEYFVDIERAVFALHPKFMLVLISVLVVNEGFFQSFLNLLGGKRFGFLRQL